MRGREEKDVAIPKYLLAVVDEIAIMRGRPTKRLIAEWLWEMARKQQGDPKLPADLTKKLRNLAKPYDPVTSNVRGYLRQASGE